MKQIIPFTPFSILCIWEESPIKADAHSPSAYTVAALEGISSTKEGYTGSFVITGQCLSQCLFLL